ncbi:hypothetical protein, partial [Edaphobacter sp. HDX4]|uniref:hypothetical protein n=1 Tax=Edaphobacter sp. HDX4 TaxID=2794064 RepID=UPI002FE550CE
KSLAEYRTIAGGVSAPIDNMVRRLTIAVRTFASGWEGTQRASTTREPPLSNKSNAEQRSA